VAAAGNSAPAFDLRRLSGPGRVSLAKLRGRPVIVNFWASYCVPCREEFPVLRDLTAKRRDVTIIGISYRDIASDSQEFARKHHANWTLARGDDGDAVARRYGIRAIPQTFFIDRRGVIRGRSFGLPSTAALNAAVKRITAR
jgi:cytochrome c biogenesis protein CcmG/thiol:disulfide interchange protein DsbE